MKAIIFFIEPGQPREKLNIGLKRSLIYNAGLQDLSYPQIKKVLLEYDQVLEHRVN